MGLRLAFERGEDEVRCQTTVGKEFVGYSDFIHGGIVTTMLDEAMGWSLISLIGRYGVTRSLRIDFRRPVRSGKRVTLSARILEVSGAEARVASTIEDSRGRLLARAEGDWVLVRSERARTTVTKDD